jgi:RimJ/RimL family protein N-acetyltransferase
MTRKIRLLPLDRSTLNDLLEVAIADAAPDEVMPPFPDPGWTPARRQAFLDFFTPMFGTIYGITVDDALAGFVRLTPTGEDGVAQTGIWLGRSYRGQGVGLEALRELLAQARALGFTKVVADTSMENLAAQGTLRRLGASLKIQAEIPIDPL